METIYRDSWNRKPKKYNKTIQPDNDNPTIEAEKGETVLTNLTDDNIPEHYNIEGKKHSQGGTKLKVPPGSYVYSDFLKIKDKETLEMFGITDGKAHTYADIAKQYDINKYKRILLDEESTKQEKYTAELMIKKYNEKLGKLALLQESVKGFPDGLPDAAEPYLTNTALNINEIFSELNGQPQVEQPAEQPVEQSKLGGKIEGRKNYRILGRNDEDRKKYRVVAKNEGGLTKYEEKGEVKGNDFTDNSYEAVYKAFQNEKVRKEFVKRFKDNLTKVKPQGNLKQSDIDAMKKMSDDEIVNTFLYGEKRVKEFVKNNVVQQGWDKNTEAHNDAAEKIGLKKFNAAQTGAFQLGYETMREMLGDDKIEKDVKDGMSGLDYFAIGPKHDKYTGRKENISVIDGYWGDNTARQYIGIKSPDEKAADKTKPDIKHLDASDKERARFMTNDLINLYGAIGDTDMLKQYQPWSQRLVASPANISYTDFRNEAHRLNSALRSGLSAQSQFTGPQQIAGMANESAATLAENMSNVTANEHRANIQLSNEFNLSNAERMDKINMANAEQKIRDYDNWVTLKDNFAREKMNYRANVRNMLTNAISNRGYLQNVNSLHDNFQIMPDGTMRMVKGTGIDPASATKDSKQQLADDYKYVAETYGLKNPDDILTVVDYLNERRDADTKDKKDKKKEEREEALSWNKLNS